MSKRTGIMLAYPLEEKRLLTYPRPWIVQPKLDGERCRAIIRGGGAVSLLSSEENVIESVPHIADALSVLYKQTGPIELDGELYRHEKPFEEIHSIVSRRVNVHDDFESMEYHVFDIVSEDTQIERTVLLNGLEVEHPVHKVGYRVMQTIEDIQEEMMRVADDGYEGIIIRHPYYPYLRKRSTGMMKFKPKKEDVYQIVGVQEEISIHGEPKGALGALILSSGEGDTFNVGSGPFLTREMRERLWREKDLLVGQYALVQYQHLTVGRRVPRFPVLMQINLGYVKSFDKGNDGNKDM